MSPSGYLTAAGVDSCLTYLATTYPSICQIVPLPESSVEGRAIRSVKIAGGTGGDRHGILLIGGVHARELVNPDLLLSFALKLCQAYTSGTGLTLGGKSYSAATVKTVVDALDIFIFPLVNPDGRVFVQSPTGDPWWRKNRNPNPGLPCKGVDINRNYDFLWSSGIGTSTYSCSEVFRGTSAFSEPETRDVRSLLDSYPNIRCMVDVHSYSELVLYPWGDDNNQTTDPSMNFANPAYTGLRGNLWDTIYKEYIPAADLDWFTTTGTRMKDSIATLRGTSYTVEQGALLYPTSGTSDDYAYSRHFVDATKRRVYAFTLETGTEFQPAYSEALNIISEVSAALFEFCLSCICVVEETVKGTTLAASLDEMRAFRDREMKATLAGLRFTNLLDRAAVDGWNLLESDARLRRQAVDLLRRVTEVVQSRSAPAPKVFEPELIGDVERFLKATSREAPPSLREALEEARRELKHFRGKTVMQGLEAASRAMEHAAKPSTTKRASRGGPT